MSIEEARGILARLLMGIKRDMTYTVVGVVESPGPLMDGISRNGKRMCHLFRMRESQRNFSDRTFRRQRKELGKDHLIDNRHSRSIINRSTPIVPQDQRNGGRWRGELPPSRSRYSGTLPVSIRHIRFSRQEPRSTPLIKREDLNGVSFM